jgi:hypothetical protein
MRHFGADGKSDEFLKLAQQNRSQGWHRLQHLAGLRQEWLRFKEPLPWNVLLAVIS